MFKIIGQTLIKMTDSLTALIVFGFFVGLDKEPLNSNTSGLSPSSFLYSQADHACLFGFDLS